MGMTSALSFALWPPLWLFLWWPFLECFPLPESTSLGSKSELPPLESPLSESALSESALFECSVEEFAPPPVAGHDVAADPGALASGSAGSCPVEVTEAGEPLFVIASRHKLPAGICAGHWTCISIIAGWVIVVVAVPAPALLDVEGVALWSAGALGIRGIGTGMGGGVAGSEPGTEAGAGNPAASGTRLFLEPPADGGVAEAAAGVPSIVCNGGNGGAVGADAASGTLVRPPEEVPPPKVLSLSCTGLCSASGSPSPAPSWPRRPFSMVLVPEGLELVMVARPSGPSITCGLNREPPLPPFPPYPPSPLLAPLSSWLLWPPPRLGAVADVPAASVLVLVLVSVVTSVVVSLRTSVWVVVRPGTGVGAPAAGREYTTTRGDRVVTV
jgi:hypothetical protein